MIQSSMNSKARELYKGGLHAGLHFLYKERAGLGAPLCAGGLHLDGMTIPSIGSKCPFFPATAAKLHELEGIEITNLTVWYSDDFGICEDDNQDARNDKFKRWSCGMPKFESVFKL